MWDIIKTEINRNVLYQSKISVSADNLASNLVERLLILTITFCQYVGD